MDVLVKTQATGDINLIVPLVINTGAPDTNATLTVKAINPGGTENTSFTAPTISEVISTTGVYKLIFSAAAANKLFTLADELNPYTVLVKTATSGSTGYRAIRVYCVSRLPGEIAKSTEIVSLAAIEESTVLAKASVVDALPTLSEIEASTVLAKDATVAKAATVALDATVAKDATVSKEATVAKAATVALDATVAKAANVPTLAQIEASTVLAKEATVALVKKFIKNKKTITSSGGVYSLVIYDDNDIDEILRKVIKDIAGADITTIGGGVIARELKSSV